jgi:3-methyladenine DNA glycosylase/8-oxoguanine DNA glycosylase
MSSPEAPLAEKWPVPRGYDFDETLRFAHTGPGDPTVLRRPGLWVKATRTPAGPATIRLVRRDTAVDVQLWGPGATWLQPRVPALLGLEDTPPTLPRGDPLTRLARSHAGVRLIRAPWPLEVLWACILQQRVAFDDAMSAHRRLVRTFGEPSPGPDPVHLPPEPAALLRIDAQAFRQAGVDAQRTATLRELCRYAHRIAETADMSIEAARQRLSALRGVGPWTLGMVMGFGFADADAVPVGDFHLPHLVCWALAGEPRGTDDRMLALLEPYRGFRFRVIRWLFAAGITAPRYGPRRTQGQ